MSRHGLRTRRPSDRGFSLVEAVVAIAILSIGLLSLAAVFTKSVMQGSVASADLVAKEKAHEVLENIVAARDSRLVQWDELRNVSDGGRFVNGEQPLRQPGDDGIIGTDDESTAALEQLVEPGPNGQLGDGDDRTIPLSHYTRQIEITAVPNEGNTLRQIRVTIRYVYSGQTRRYELVSLVSSYS